MTGDIRDYISACDVCRTYETANQRETLMSHDIPDRPWAKIGTDLFPHNGKDYLVTVDYYSNFWEVDYLADTKAQTTIGKLKAHYARHGIPDTIVSDNGPQYSCHAFARFCESWDITHVTSSPYNSKANGKAESAVKTCKQIMRKCIDSGSDPFLAIPDHRNTPSQGLLSSPAQRLMSRRTKTLLPTVTALLRPQIVIKRLDERSYVIDTPKGVVRRNPEHLKKTTENYVQQPTDGAVDFRRTDSMTPMRSIPEIDLPPERETPDTDIPVSTAAQPLERAHSSEQRDIVTRSGRAIKLPTRYRD